MEKIIPVLMAIAFTVIAPAQAVCLPNISGSVLSAPPPWSITGEFTDVDFAAGAFPGGSCTFDFEISVHLELPSATGPGTFQFCITEAAPFCFPTSLDPQLNPMPPPYRYSMVYTADDWPVKCGGLLLMQLFMNLGAGWFEIAHVSMTCGNNC